MFDSTRRALVAAMASIALVACGSSSGDTGSPGNAGTSGNMTDAGIHFIGDADAPIVLEEYASVMCSACEAFHATVYPMIKSDYIETGLVRVDFHEFPTPPADLAVAGFAVARCAGDDKYFDVIDAIFANRTGLIRAYQAGQAGPALGAIAETHGLDQEAYEACLGSEDVLRTITRIVEAGETRGVRATPTFFMNGERITDGRFQFEEGARMILNAELEKLGLEPVAAPVPAEVETPAEDVPPTEPEETASSEPEADAPEGETEATETEAETDGAEQ